MSDAGLQVLLKKFESIKGTSKQFDDKIILKLNEINITDAGLKLLGEFVLSSGNVKQIQLQDLKYVSSVGLKDFLVCVQKNALIESIDLRKNKFAHSTYSETQKTLMKNDFLNSLKIDIVKNYIKGALTDQGTSLLMFEYKLIEDE